MVTIGSWPEPLMEHLWKEPAQPWDHRWRQFLCVTKRGGAWLHLSYTPFKGCLPLGKDLWLEVSLVLSFLCKPGSLEVGEYFFFFFIASFYCAFSLAIISPVTSLYCIDLSDCYSMQLWFFVVNAGTRAVSLSLPVIESKWWDSLFARAFLAKKATS